MPPTIPRRRPFDVKPNGASGFPSSVGPVAPDTFMGSQTFLLIVPLQATSTASFTQSVSPQSFSATTASALQGLTGIGNFGYSYASTTTASVPPLASSVSLQPSSRSSATLSVLYDYTPGTPPTSVPEPGTGLLMMAGLGAMAFVRRRRSVQG